MVLKGIYYGKPPFFKVILTFGIQKTSINAAYPGLEQCRIIRNSRLSGYIERDRRTHIDMP